MTLKTGVMMLKIQCCVTEINWVRHFLFSGCAYISLSLSPRLLSFCSACTHTSLSLSHRLFIFCSACAHTHLSLSLIVCSFSVQRAHTHLSLCIYSVSVQRRAELNSTQILSLIQLNTDIVACFSNFSCKYSQNHSTAIVIILWVFYLVIDRYWFL